MQAEIKRLARDFDGTNTDREVIRILGIDRGTYYRYKKEIINIRIHRFCLPGKEFHGEYGEIPSAILTFASLF